MGRTVSLWPEVQELKRNMEGLSHELSAAESERGRLSKQIQGQKHQTQRLERHEALLRAPCTTSWWAHRVTRNMCLAESTFVQLQCQTSLFETRAHLRGLLPEHLFKNTLLCQPLLA